jgi:hypothetical protein
MAGRAVPQRVCSGPDHPDWPSAGTALMPSPDYITSCYNYAEETTHAYRMDVSAERNLGGLQPGRGSIMRDTWT